MPFIILDRDGVINYDSDFYIKSPDEFHTVPGSLEAIAKLNKAGYQVLVATNQSGIARGLYTVEMLEKIHAKLHSQLAEVGGKIQEIFYCPHHPDEDCPCRKPKPGMFHQIQEKYALDFSETYFIGDTITDVHVANAVGCKPMLILSIKGQKTLEKHPEVAKYPHYANLAEAVESILSQR
jgi:D-glycero-D-manno-heptose 1,7-bisphosphate phosphatase